MLSYILFNPALHSTLRSETALAYVDSKINVPCLVESCPRLEAVYYKTLRVVNGALSGRKIVASTPMGNKILEKSNTLLISFRHLHYNTDVLGKDPAAFQPERFLRDPGLKTSASFKVCS